MGYFTVQFPLIVEKWQADILNKRFEMGRKIYNSLVKLTLNRYEEMIKNEKYKELLASIQREEDGKALENKYNKKFLK